MDLPLCNTILVVNRIVKHVDAPVALCHAYSPGEPYTPVEIVRQMLSRYSIEDKRKLLDGGMECIDVSKAMYSPFILFSRFAFAVCRISFVSTGNTYNKAKTFSYLPSWGT